MIKYIQDEDLFMINNNNIILPEALSLFYSQIGNGCKMIDGYELKGLYELEFNETKINE